MFETVLGLLKFFLKLSLQYLSMSVTYEAVDWPALAKEQKGWSAHYSILSCDLVVSFAGKNV